MNVTEKEIIGLLVSRDERGMDEFIKHYKPLIVYVISPILKSEHDRDECVSEVLLKIWEKIGSYDSLRGSFTSWLTAAARNSALSFERSRKLRETDEIPEDALSHELTPEEKILRNERRESLVRALSSLPQRERVLFYRKYYYLQPTAQIAAELGTTERAVEGKLYRIKKKLREILGGEGYE